MSKTMEETLNNLVKLQETNRVIERLRKDCDSLNVDVDQQQETVRILEVRLQEAKDLIKLLQRDADSRELSIRSLEDEIQNLNVQLNQIRNQKEYDAIRHEVQGKQDKISQHEDAELENLAKIDEAKASIAEVQGQVKDEQERLARIQAEVDKEMAEYQGELAEVEAERERLRDGIDPQILDQYDRLTANKSNPLVGVRDRVCQGCFTLVPMQILNEVMRKDHLVFCHSCGRLLFLDESGSDF